MFHGAMSWTLAVLGVLALLGAVNAIVPVRREPFSLASFTIGFTAGEVPLHSAVLIVMLAGVLMANGAAHHLPGQIGVVLCVVATGIFCVLGVEALRSGGRVATALDEATGGPLGGADEVGRAAWVTWARMVVAFPIRGRRIRRNRNLDYWGDGASRHRLDILTGRDDRSGRAPVMVWYHGGAWIMGDKREQGLPMLYELARRGWVCVTVNYRLSPQATWPDQIVDCKRALAWVKEHIADYGGDPSFVAVSGGSAGGHLAALVALTPDRQEWQPGFEAADTSVDACIPFYGAHDLTGDHDAAGLHGDGVVRLLERRVMKVTLASDRERFESASSDRCITSSAPPMLVIQGKNDTLVPPEVARRFVSRLRQVSKAPVAYVELPFTQHAFELMATPKSRATTLGVVRFVDAVRQRRERDTPPRF